MAQRFSAPGQYKGRGSSSGVPRSLIALVVVAALIFVLGVREGDSGPLHTVRGVYQTLTMPVRYLGDIVASPVEGLSNIFVNLTADTETLTDLQEKNAELEAEVARLSEYESQADTLTRLLELRNTYNLTSTAASVIANSTDSWSATITIDKGSSSGISVGMPVSSNTGIVGQITEVGLTTSTVRLITDENSGVSAMVQSSRAHGQLVGSADGTLRLTLVRTDQQVSVGDTIITSGLGGTYPRGLPLGTVSNITKTNGAMYYEITVNPLSSLSALENVLVITSLTDEQQATAEDIAEANSQDSAAVVTSGSNAVGSDDSSDTSDTDASDNSATTE